MLQYLRVGHNEIIVSCSLKTQWFHQGEQLCYKFVVFFRFHYAARIWDGVKKVLGPLRIQPPPALTPGLICFCIAVRPRLFKNQAS